MTNQPKFAAKSLEYILFLTRDDFCYLLIPADILLIKTLLLQISANIIRIQISSDQPPGKSISSLTDRAAQLKINPLFAFLNGFEIGNNPGVGNFYHFLSRPWSSELPSHSSRFRPAKEREFKKLVRKGAKSELVYKVSIDQLLKQLESTSFAFDEQLYAFLFKIYHRKFLSQSITKELINPSNLSIAGDGTPVVSSARERKHPACSCSEKGISYCSYGRFFFLPGCNIGWYSSSDCFYFDHGLYMLVEANSESELPVSPVLNPASGHDSLGFLETWFRMRAFLPDLHVANDSWILPMMQCHITFTVVELHPAFG